MCREILVTKGGNFTGQDHQSWVVGYLNRASHGAKQDLTFDIDPVTIFVWIDVGPTCSRASMRRARLGFSRPAGRNPADNRHRKPSRHTERCFGCPEQPIGDHGRASDRYHLPGDKTPVAHSMPIFTKFVLLLRQPEVFTPRGAGSPICLFHRVRPSSQCYRRRFLVRRDLCTGPSAGAALRHPHSLQGCAHWR
jgi:hypothetical protein